jgi:hypothetical protein
MYMIFKGTTNTYVTIAQFSLDREPTKDEGSTKQNNP